MKLKLITIFGLATVAANAATNSSIANFSLPASALPIVDNAGNPIATADSSIQFGSFSDAFAATLGDLDTLTADDAVIAAFTPTGPSGVFAQPGLFNAVLQTDGTGALGDAAGDNGAYALVTWTGGVGNQALVIDLGQAFPKQVAGNANLTLGRAIEVGDVAFGNKTLVDADTSALPPPFQPFSRGITFDAGAVIPEPSTGLLSLIAGLGLLGRRRR